MKIYLRKIFKHDTTHEVSVRRDIVKDFFDNATSFIIIGLSSNFKANVTINDATDPRFGGEFKELLRHEVGTINIDDLILIKKEGNVYILEVIKLSDGRYDTFFNIFSGNLRHAILFVEDEDEEEGPSEVKSYTYLQSTYVAENVIVYGTPGCGKSYYVKNELCKNIHPSNITRTTFYQDYTNTDFVGQILPTIDGDKVTYNFTPGPFTIALNQAINKPNEPVALIIEELNRGNAPSIFGDLFQLLDRTDGVSEYSIYNDNIQKYLQKHNRNYTFNEVRIPSNMNIFATMNSSDQNVFTLDTAFKRRWRFEKIKNSFDGSHHYAKMYVPGMNKTWEEFVVAVNKYIVEDLSLTSSEDKQLGVYFLDSSTMRYNENDALDDKKLKEFSFKIFDYLWNDVAKFDRERWFKENIKTLDDLIENYSVLAQTNEGQKVFNFDFT